MEQQSSIRVLLKLQNILALTTHHIQISEQQVNLASGSFRETAWHAKSYSSE